MFKRFVFLFLSLLAVHFTEAQVSAAFTANQTAGCPNPFLLILSDNSAAPGPIDAWTWTLSGPAGFTTQTSTVDQLSTTLTIPGLYTVTLIACSGGVCDTATQTDFIEVFTPPSVGMVISPLLGCPPLEVCFDGTFSAGCGTIVSSVIDVKDGTVYADVEDVCHTYPFVGSFTDFTVSVSNSCGCLTTEIYTDVVTVSLPPVASFASSNSFSCSAPFNVNFNSTSSNTEPGTTYEWNIPPLVNGANTQNINQVFPVGSYDVELIVTNPSGCADTIFQPNYVVVGNPIADFTIDTTSGCPGTLFNFTDLSSGNPIAWDWTFEGHGSSSAQNPTVNFTNSGSWGVSLVTQYAGGCSDSIYQANLVDVLQDPTNNFAITDNSACFIPFTTTFTNGSVNADSTIFTFPGGSPATHTGFAPVDVTYNAYGSYSVLITSFSSQGCSSSTSYNNFIDLQALQASVLVDSTGGCVPLTSNLSFTLSAGEVAASQNWTLPGSDIGASILPNPTAVYNASGCYDVTLSVATVSGCTTTVTDSSALCAGSPPIGGFSLSPISFCFEEEIVTFSYTGAGADTILWDFGDNSSPVFAPDDASVTYNYPDDIGSFTVSMIPFQYGCPGDTTVYVDTVQVLGPISVFDAVFDGCTNWNTFNFTDQSVQADSVFYEFGDPSATDDTSSQFNPSWIYPAIDSITSYTVTQYAYNFTTGCMHQSSNTIAVYPPNADFTVSDTIGCSPKTIQLFNNSLETQPISAATLWNYVDNYVWSGPGFNTIWNNNVAPFYTYSNPGVYTVIMRNSDLRGCIDTLRRPNLITIHGVNVGFTQDSTQGCAPLTVNFTDTSNAPLSYVESLHWDFGVSGTLADTSNLQNPNFTYDIPGIYTVTLSATDSFGCTNIATSTVNVTGALANFSLSDTFFCTNQNIGLINQSLGTGLSYAWTFVNGTPATSNAQNPPALSYANEGSQDILLEVTDSFGCFDDTTVSVPVFDVVAQATSSTNFISCFANTTAVSFNNTSFNNIDSSSVFWDLGNGTSSTLFNPSAVYNLAGSYIVSLSIASNTGCIDTSIVDTIFVGGPYGEVNVIGSDSACFCETVSFEVLTWNATNPSLITGDGGIIPFLPNGILGDTILDTLSYQYCQTGTFVPQLFIDDGTCSGNIELSDTIRVDSVIANFGIGPLPSCGSGTVCFFDSSFNLVQGTTGLDVYNWDFGDGSTSNIANPCHNYSASGLYNVRLSVSSNFNCLDTVEYQVLIPASLDASIDISDSVGCIGQQLLLWDSTSVDSSTSIQSWDWDFGNGASSSVQNPTTIYNIAGTYTITLLVTDSNGCIGIDSVNTAIFSLPNISTTNDTAVCIGDSIQLNTTGGVSYNWQPNYNISDNSIADPFVFPAVDTTYLVEGIDVNGCSNLDTVFVEVRQVEAFFSAPSVCLNETSIFTDLSASDGIITDWTWIFGEPLSGANDTSLLQNPTHDYLSQGSFDVTLVVTDDNLCLADTTIAVFIQDAPSASFTADSVCFGESHTFNSDSSFAAGANIISYHWDFGVGGTLTDTSNIANTFFTYNTPGLYTVCLTIETDQSCAGNVDDTCFVVQVYELPDVNFILDSACLGNQVNFTDLTVLASNAGVFTSFWDFGQNPQDTLLGFSSPLSTQFLYDSTGQYNVTLTVIDSNLCISDDTETAVVLPNPAGNFSFATACQNQNNEFVALPSFASAGNLVYYWDFDEGLGFQLGDSIETYNFVVTGNHQVNLAIVDALGCSDTVQQLIVILDAPSAIITGDNTVCRGVSTTLSGSSSTVLAPPAIYDWSVTASQTSQITYSPNSDTDVFLTVTDNSGCVDSTSVFIDVLEVPEADFDWTDACEDIQISLTSLAQEGDALLINYTWNINSAISGAVTFNTVNANYTVPTIDTLSVTFIVEDANNCIDSINQIIVVDQQVDLDILTPDYLLCPGDSLLVDLGDITRFVSIGVGGTVWSPTAGIVSISGDSILLAPTTSISYNISASSILGQCPPDDDNFINVDLAPDPFISLDAFPNPVLAGAISNITAGVIPFNVNTDSLIWDNSSGTLNTDFGFNLDASPIEETTYPAQLIYYFDSLRCVKDTAITIFVITECNGELIYIPNIFTPNDDGKNDEFGLIGYGIEVINYLRIFDRWGQLLFDGVDLEMNNGRMFPGAGWLGENQGGKDCNSGVYVYTYELRCANGDVVRGSGNVTLIK